MIDYRCYLLSSSGAIQAAEDITCVDDEAALARARELFQPNDFELWHRERRVYPLVRSVDVER